MGLVYLFVGRSLRRIYGQGNASCIFIWVEILLQRCDSFLLYAGAVRVSCMIRVFRQEDATA